MKQSANWRRPAGDRFGEAEGRALVEEFLASGLSAAEFSRRHGVTKQKISYWTRRVSELARPGRTRTSAFVPVRAAKQRQDAGDGPRDGEQMLRVKLGEHEVSVTGPWNAASISLWLSALEGRA